MSSTSNLYNFQTLLAQNLNFYTGSTCTAVPPSWAESTGIFASYILTVSTTSAEVQIVKKRTLRSSSISVLKSIAKKKRIRVWRAKTETSGYHPCCLPRSFRENKKLFYPNQILKILAERICSCVGVNFIAKFENYRETAKPTTLTLQIQKSQICILEIDFEIMCSLRKFRKFSSTAIIWRLGFQSQAPKNFRFQIAWCIRFF